MIKVSLIKEPVCCKFIFLLSYKYYSSSFKRDNEIPAIKKEILEEQDDLQQMIQEKGS